ncbi:nitroreductase family protein [Myroides sp. LJL119]
MSLIEDLKWRFATKAYDPTKKINQEDLNKILQAINLAPSSSGLQQYRVVVVQDQKTKDLLTPGALNPECMKDCSAILVFAAWDKYTDHAIDQVYDQTTDAKNLPRGRFNSYTDGLKKELATWEVQQQIDHAAKQAYIGLGLAIAQAAELRIDSTPAEGFDPQVIDKVLDLPAKGLRSTVLLYLGYKDPEKDWNSQLPKFRIGVEQLVVDYKK